MIMVAPLTTALMSSVPKHNSGVASAVNNAISRVGPQLAGAVIFVAIAASFYSSMSAKVPGLDTSSSRFRTAVAPLNKPDPSVAPEVRRAARSASTESFHLGMIVAAVLLFVGAAVNALGIRNPQGPEWMRRPRDADRTAVPRLVAERAGKHPPERAASRGDPPPWAADPA